jgi:hypothetical protein
MVPRVRLLADRAAVLGGAALFFACGESVRTATNAGADGAIAGSAGVPAAGRASTGGAGGASAGAATGGAPSVSVDPDTTRAYTWEECGRIPSSPGDHDAHYAGDGTLALLLGSGRLVLRSAVEREIVADIPSDATKFAISNDATLLVEPTDSGVTLRSLPDGDPIDTLSSPAEGCPSEAVGFSPAGDMVMTYGGSGLCAWRVADGTLLVRLSEASYSAAFDEDAIVVAYYPTTDRGMATVARFDLTGVELARFPLELESHQLQPIVSPDGTTVATPHVYIDDAAVCALWNSDDGELLWTHSQNDCGGVPLFSPAGDLVNLGSTFRVNDGAMVWRKPDDPRDFGVPLALSPTGDELTIGVGRTLGFHLAALNSDGPEGLPRSWSGHLRIDSDFPVHPMRSLAITADGARLVSLATEGLSWALAPRFEDSTPRTGLMMPYLSRVEVSPDGRWASVAGDGRVVQSLEGEGNVHIEEPDSGGIGPCIWLQFRFSPDGQWLVGNSYSNAFNSYRVADFLLGDGAMPAWSANEAGCPTIGRLGSGYPAPIDADGNASKWPRFNAVAPGVEPEPYSSFGREPYDDLVYSPDGEDSILTTGCSSFDDADEPERCEAKLSSTRWAAESLPETLPHFPDFDPEGHWIVAGSTLVHLPSGDVRVLNPKAAVALFTPDGDIIAGERDASLVRYCRTPRAP